MAEIMTPFCANEECAFHKVDEPSQLRGRFAPTATIVGQIGPVKERADRIDIIDEAGVRRSYCKKCAELLLGYKFE